MAEWKNRIVGYGLIPISEIVKNPNNPKEHPEYQKRVLSGVLEDVGIVQNIIVNRTTGHLVDGECRYFLAIDNGEESLPATFVELTLEEETKILLTLDETAMFARRNMEKIGEIIKGVTTHSDSMRDLIDRIARQSRVNLDQEDDGDYEDDGDQEDTGDTNQGGDKDNDKEREELRYQELIGRWKVEPGKIWMVKSLSLNDGCHKIMCGDSRDSGHVMALLDGTQKASLMVTDPPYGVNFKEQKYNPRAKDWDAIKNDDIAGEGYRRWIKSFLDTWMPYMNPDASYYIWTAALNEAFMCLKAMEDAGIKVRSHLVWSKNTLVLGQADYQWIHENCWYGYRDGMTHRWYGGRDQVTVWSIPKVANIRYLHPMQKPVEIYSRPIKNHTRSGDICVDPFFGSGTQLIACEALSRLCYAMEYDPRYVAVSLERIHNDLGLEISEV